MKVFILTAGRGTRFPELTKVIPKPAVPFLNIPLAYYSMFLMEQSGINQFVFNLHHLPNKMKNTLLEVENKFRSFEFSEETETILGGAGGLKKAMDYFKDQEDILLANGDEVLIPEDSQVIKKMIDAHLADNSLATLMCMKHPLAGTKFGAIWVDKNGHVKAIGKKDKVESSLKDSINIDDLSPYHFTGYQILKKSVKSYIPEGESNIFYDVLVKAIAEGKQISIYRANCEWFETGNKLDYLKASAQVFNMFLNGNTYLKNMRQFFNNITSGEQYARITNIKNTFSEHQSQQHHTNFLIGKTSVFDQQPLSSFFKDSIQDIKLNNKSSTNQNIQKVDSSASSNSELCFASSANDSSNVASNISSNIVLNIVLLPNKLSAKHEAMVLESFNEISSKLPNKIYSNESSSLVLVNSDESLIKLN